MAPTRLCLLSILAIFVVTGCPSRFDPRAAQLAAIHSPNPDAEADYSSAQRKWQEGDLAGAEAALKLFFAKHGQDGSEPLLPLGQLLAGRVARSLGDLERASTILRPLSDSSAAGNSAIAPLARFELGLCEYQRGELGTAQKLLAPFSGQIVDGDDATELYASLADIYRRTDQPADAVREYEQFYQSHKVRPLEQVYIRSQIATLLGRFSPNEQRSLRSRFGLAEGGPPASANPSDRWLTIGLVLPLSGKDRALGERVLRGAYFAARAAAGPAPAAAAGSAVAGERLHLDLRLRDSGAMTAAEAVAELADEGAQAIIGSPVRSESLAVSSEAERRGLLGLSLASPVPGQSAGPYQRSAQLLRSNEARAELLAQKLRQSGLTSVAILAPATPYGQSMSRAFAAALAGSSVQLVAQLSFPAQATTFTSQAQQLLAQRPQALFIPATAQQLELVSGQLAAVGALATYRVEKRDVEPPIRLLLSTAEGMGERLLKSAGRYLQGALLAPISPGGSPLVGDDGHFRGYATDGGGEPGALDALGFDAVKLLHAACLATTPANGRGPGRCTAAELHSALATLHLIGATGPLSFDPSGKRKAAAWLFQVDGSALRPVEPAEGR